MPPINRVCWMQASVISVVSILGVDRCCTFPVSQGQDKRIRSHAKIFVALLFVALRLAPSMR